MATPNEQLLPRTLALLSQTLASPLSMSVWPQQEREALSTMILSSPVLPFAADADRFAASEIVAPSSKPDSKGPAVSHLKGGKLRTWVVRVWYASQVELWGNYSVERMLALDSYSRSSSTHRVTALLVGSFLPCLLVEMALDALPLAPTELGLSHSRNFWIRTTVMSYIVTHSLISQYRHNVPGLALSTKQTITISAIAALLVQPLLYLMAKYIGYPIPFFMVLTLVPWIPIVYSMAGYILYDQLRNDSRIRDALVRYFSVFNAQSCLIFIYPTFSYVFNLYPEHQTGLVLLLPVMKLLLRNWFSHCSGHIQDLKPELVVFNVEIFSALYVSSCMQRATSIYTTLVIMAVDFLQACLSIKDLNDVLDDEDLRRALGKDSDTRMLVPLAQHLLRTNNFVRNHPSIQIETCVSRLESLGAIASRNQIAPVVAVVSAPEVREVVGAEEPRQPQKADEPDAKRNSSKIGSALAGLAAQLRDRVSSSSAAASPPRQRRKSAHDRLDHLLNRFARPHNARNDAELERIVVALSDAEKLMMVQKTLKILHIAEFIGLVEYSEVVVPILYSLFTIAAYTFPNRDSYASLKNLTPSQFAGTLGNVFLYGSLELLSYVMLDFVMKKKFHVSAFTQTAFVLETQWAMVQSKLFLWIMVVLQFAHEHYGSDFSFQFKWLNHNKG